MADTDTDLKLDDFGPGDVPSMPDGDTEARTASDLAPVFDVPVSISAVLGRATMTVAQLLQLTSGRPRRGRHRRRSFRCDHD